MGDTATKMLSLGWWQASTEEIARATRAHRELARLALENEFIDNINKLSRRYIEANEDSPEAASLAQTLDGGRASSAELQVGFSFLNGV